MRRGSIRVRTNGDREFTCDAACERCGNDDPCIERERPTATQIQWLCLDCAEADARITRSGSW